MDKNLHFKMYKAGKRWLFAGIASATLMTMGGVSLAHADDTDSGAPVSEVTADTPDDGDVVALSSASIPDSTADDSSSAASEADSTASSAADSTASSATSDAPAVATHSLTGQQTWTDTDLATASFIPVTETGTFKAGDKLTFNYNPNDFAWVKNDTVAGTTVSTNTTAGTVTYTFTQDMTASIAIYVKYNNLPKATSSWANGLQSATSTVSTILNGAALDDLDITVNKVYTFKNPAIYIKNVGSSYGVANEAITSNGTVVSDGILSLNPYGLYQILSNGGNAFTRSSAVVSQDIVFTYSALTNVQIDSVTWLGTLPAGVSYTNTDNTVTITIAAGTPYSTIVSMSSSSVQVNWHTIDGSTKESTPWTGAIITGALDEQSFSYTGTAGQIGTNVSLARIAGGYNINDGSHVSALTEVAQAGNTTKVITIGATATANYIDPNPDNTLSDSEDFSTTNMNYNITGIQTTNGVTYTITLASGQVITIVGDGTMQTLAIDSTVDPIKNIATLALNSGTMIWSTEGALYGNVSLIDPSQLGYMSRTYNSYSAVDNNSGLSATRASNLLPGDILSGIKFITAPSYQMTNSGMVQSDYNAAMTVGAGTGSTIYITVSETGLLTTPFIKAIAVANPVWVLTAPKDTIFGSNGIPTKGLVYTYSADMKTLTITYDPTAVTTTVQYAGTTSQNNSLAVTYTLVPLPSAYPGEVIGQPNVTLTFDNTIVQNLNIETVTNATALARDSFSTDGDRTTIIYDGAQGMLGTVVAPATYYQQTSIQGSGDTAVQASTGTIDLSKSNTLTISDILYDGMKSDVPDTLTTLNLRDSTNQLGVHLTAPIQIVDVDGNPITGATIVYLTAQGIVTTYDQAVSIQISGVSIAQAKIAKIIATVSLDDPDTTIVTGKSLAVTWTTQPLNADGSAISTALSTTNTIKATRTVTASYNLIDSDDSNKVLSTVTDTGAIGTKYDGTVTIPDNYVLVGYQLADGTKVTGITTQTFSEVVGSDGTINGQTYQVLLKHATTSELVPVTETVNYAGLPSDKAVASQNQTVNATKITDLVTGAITWTEAQFDAINSPAVAGYTPNQSSVAATSSTNGTISSVTVTYTANATTATLNIVDTDNGNKVVQSFEVSGVVDGLIDWSSVNDAIVALTDKYNFTSGGMGTTFKADPASNIYQMTVTEKHTTGSYVQTINYVATGLPTAKNVSYDASKVGYDTDTNLVTGVTTYTLGKYGLMQDSDIQDVAGYTATIGAVNLDATSTTAPADQTVNVSYAANAQSITVNYVDDDDSGSIVSTDTLNGVTDQAVDYEPSAPANYVLVDGTEIPSNFEGGQVITVHVTEKHETGSIDQTLNITTSGLPSAKDVTYQAETVTYNTDTNLVTGITTYTPVSGFDAVSVQDVAGYTATVGTMPVTATSTIAPADQTVNVSYVANAQTITVNYVDDDDSGSIVSTDTLNGVTDQAVDYEPSAPANYVLVDGTEIPSNFEGGQVITVHVTEKHETGSIDQTLNITTSGLPSAKDVTYQAETVTYNTDTNLVTGITTYTPVSGFDAVSVQDVAGYTATVGTMPVTATSTEAPADQTVNVSYAANAQSITVNYVDDDFSTLTDRHSLDLKTSSLIKTETLDGITDQAVVFTPDYLPAGYVFVNVTGQPATFSSDGGQVITVHYYHHMTDSQFTRTFTIHYVGAGDQTPVDVVYNLLLDEERDDVSGVGLYDLRSVNGERMTSTDWMTTATPEIAGYTALTTSVDYDEFFPLTNQYDYSVSPEDLISDRYTTVTYTPNAQTITVNYVDDDDNSAIVDSNTLNGVTDQAVEFTPSAPANYNLVAGTEIPSTFSADGGQVITVHLTHKTSSQDEAKTISRLVKFVDAKGNDLLPSVLQTANFTRVATTDAATGLVSYTAWVSDNAELNAVNAPALSGLTPDQNGAAAETLTGDSINNVVSVVYSDITAPDMPSEAVTPVSPDGGTTTVSGTAEPNSLVTVITADGSKLTQQTGNDGAYSIDVPSAQIGDVIAVTATDDAGNVSDANQQSVGAAVVQKDVVDDPISVNPDDFYQTVTVEFVDQNGNVIGTSDVKITNHQDVNVNVPTGYSHLNDDGTYTSDVLINDGTDHQQVLVTKIQSQVITDDGGVTNQNGDGQITKTAVGAPLSVNAKDFYDNTAKQVVSPVDPKPIKTETHEPTLKDALIPVETEPKQGASLTQIEDSLDNGVAVLPNTGAAMQQRPELVMVGLSAFLLAITGLLAKKRQDSDK